MTGKQMILTIGEAQSEAWQIAEDKGFHEGHTGTGRDDTLVRLFLVQTEISEAGQEVKRHWAGEPTHDEKLAFAEELADATIRILDLAECVGVDLEWAIVRKMVKNRDRPYLYGTAHAETKP